MAKQARRLRLSNSTAAQAALIAGGSRQRAAWYRDVWERRSDPRLRPLGDGMEEFRVAIDDDLLERIRAAADRAGLALEEWMRRAVEVEISYLALLDAVPRKVEDEG